MPMARDERREALRDLIELRMPVADGLCRLGAFNRFDGPVVFTLRLEHIRRALERYLDGHLTADEVAAWADVLEAREDLMRDPAHEESIEQLILLLSSPELRALTPAEADGLLYDIRAELDGRAG